jgi:hypothetical protein
MDLSKLSDKDLEAIASGDMSKVSTSGLRYIANYDKVEAAKKPIREMLQMSQAPAEPPSPGGIARQLGLTARAAISGLTSLPTMVADPITGLMNIAAGKQVAAPPSQTVQTLLDQLFPKPETSRERVAQDVASALSGTGVAAKGAEVVSRVAKSPTVQRVASILARDPRAQAAAAIGGSAAAGAAREEGAGPLTQLGAGMIGSITPAGAPGAAKSAAQVGRAIVQPFTQEGREVIIGNVLRRSATLPDEAAVRMQAAPEFIPGSAPTMAEAARDPGLLALQGPVSKIFDPQNLIGERMSQQNLARMREFERLAGTPETLEAARTARGAVTAPMREEAFLAQAQFGPLSSDALNPIRTAIAEIIRGETGGSKPVRDTMKFVQGLIRDVEEGGPLTPQRLYGIRKDIRMAQEGLFDKDDFRARLAAQELSQIRSVLDNVIESAAPGFKSYVSEYRQMSQPVSQMELMQDIGRRSTVAAPDITAGVTSVPIFSQAKLRNQLTARADEINRTLTEEQQTMLNNLMNDLNRTASLTSAVARRPGSDTFKNFSTANLIGSMFSDVLAGTTTVKSLSRPLDFLYKLPDQQIADLMVEAMLDPKLASLMMQKASKMTVEPVSKALRKKAEDLGFAPLISGMQAE